MRQRVLNTVAAMVVAMPAILAVGSPAANADGPTGGATGGGGTFLAFTQILRRCDFSGNTHVGPTGYAGPTATVRRVGGEVVADVQVVRAIPGTVYVVGLVQMPHSSAVGCNPGDPGVISGVLTADGLGSGSVTIRGPVASDTTGAWMYLSRPGYLSQTPDEFYTSDFVAKL
ncbi:hypothetical protein A5724_18780 [Mycobacterium sp. ACS1612]|uniref:hypothetical protein n=1 Tax=Mycobacterium sp. ACS1612 TaxID=1834117 RepID=UPI0007FE64F0|nr:hypothetical protein [Mycobacterium sp. ACS1612]OBF33733.1 hypothetical protein A5724_18780 [Mycobacterium sp. ACS1612]